MWYTGVVFPSCQCLPAAYIEPPTNWDDVGLAANALASRCIYNLEGEAVMDAIRSVYDLLFWQNWTKSFAVLITSMQSA